VAGAAVVFLASCSSGDRPVLAAIDPPAGAVDNPAGAVDNPAGAVGGPDVVVDAATPTATAVPPTPLPTPEPRPTPTPTTARVVNDQAYEPFAAIDELTLVHPAARVEHIGLHQSGHDGARLMTLLGIDTAATTMESRGRQTLSRTAADIVVDPDAEIRAPVTGTVLSAGTYVLYCEYSDDFVYIEPDDRPGWQVKMFHIDGVEVVPGQRVEAGVTVLAGRATVLPFESQVDEHTAEPSWPHVHLEVVDPSIPDRPSEGGC